MNNKKRGSGSSCNLNEMKGEKRGRRGQKKGCDILPVQQHVILFHVETSNHGEQNKQHIAGNINVYKLFRVKKKKKEKKRDNQTKPHDCRRAAATCSGSLLIRHTPIKDSPLGSLAVCDNGTGVGGGGES